MTGVFMMIKMKRERKVVGCGRLMRPRELQRAAHVREINLSIDRMTARAPL